MIGWEIKNSKIKNYFNCNGNLYSFNIYNGNNKTNFGG